MNSHAVIEGFYSAIDELNPTLKPIQRLEKRPDLVLFGSGAQLDSLEFVNLILFAEEALSVKFGVPVILTEVMLADGDVPLPQTLGALADFVAERLQQQVDE